jgi:hypothetical protein
MRIRIRIKLKGKIRIRIMVKDRVRIRIKVKGRIRIRIKVKSRIPIRVYVMRIRNIGYLYPQLSCQTSCCGYDNCLFDLIRLQMVVFGIKKKKRAFTSVLVILHVGCSCLSLSWIYLLASTRFVFSPKD